MPLLITMICSLQENMLGILKHAKYSHMWNTSKGLGQCLNGVAWQIWFPCVSGQRRWLSTRHVLFFSHTSHLPIGIQILCHRALKDVQKVLEELRGREPESERKCRTNYNLIDQNGSSLRGCFSCSVQDMICLKTK